MKVLKLFILTVILLIFYFQPKQAPAQTIKTTTIQHRRAHFLYQPAAKGRAQVGAQAVIAHRVVDLQRELDRILEKVHRNGIQSLTSKEKKTLKQATREQQTRNDG